MSKQNARVGRIEKEMRSILSMYVINQMRSYFDCLVSVAAVKVASDIRSAKIYVSVFGENANAEEVLETFEDFRADIQSHIGHSLRIKYVPKLQFFIDNTFEENFQVMDKLKDLGFETKASDFNS